MKDPQEECGIEAVWNSIYMKGRLASLSGLSGSSSSGHHSGPKILRRCHVMTVCCQSRKTLETVIPAACFTDDVHMHSSIAKNPLIRCRPVTSKELGLTITVSIHQPQVQIVRLGWIERSTSMSCNFRSNCFRRRARLDSNTNWTQPNSTGLDSTRDGSMLEASS